MLKIFLLLNCCLAGVVCRAQHSYDTIHVMSYNVLNYGFPSTQSCPALITANKHAWLCTILQSENPDILGLEKMDASPESFTTDTVISAVLDSVCAGCYGHTPYTNYSGYSKENMLYFKTAKLGWVSTTTIYSADSNISDINLHTLFYKDSLLGVTHDTVYLRIILVHLESGSGSAAERNTEMTGAMNWLNSHVNTPGNYIFMGDFNTQSSNEGCYQQMVSSANPNTLFYDVAGHPGNWNNDPSDFAGYLTQSTRSTDPGDCGATGGMNDWFDHMLCTGDIMADTGWLRYIDGSFHVIGQDGQHVNKSLLANPPNTSVPGDVLNALYYMSEHLPVTMQLAVKRGGLTTGVSGTLATEVQWHYNTIVTDKLHLSGNGCASQPFEAAVYDLSGQLLYRIAVYANRPADLPMQWLAPGMYIINVTQGGRFIMSGKFVKPTP